ncbi:tetratricopeptide repeat protein [Lentzea tibetensis]|uniref:Tetratricopeptide repeat protein n=1 Tax=Lentzea tibetensis TaxID=2591470 RepID=A0A563F213_9PSEU|nr:BTAD domain-containing putative transcriptional regulator [Lentzea tibetensis]TWP54026.1 tetratricopeptide repeat protein [Lentzea tibetensis]
MAVELRVLGDVEARIESRRIEVGHARQRCVLAVLVVEANRVVTVDQLLDRVWSQDLPHRGRQVLRTYLSRLRLLLAPGGIGIERRPNGYLLRADPDIVDMHQFHRLVAQARATDDEHALGLFEQASALWRGEPFAGLDTPWLASVRAGLERERVASQLDHIDVALRCGQHTRLFPALSTLADQNPLDERVAGQLMLALYRIGRRADALAHYQRTRQHLVEELGTDPAPELQQLHQRILTAELSLMPVATTRVSAGAGSAVVPRQLPAAPSVFTGREGHLAMLTSILDYNGTVMISAIGGAGGIGKTWLALTWAHRHLDQFPDGQLFVDLRGFSPDSEPMAPAAAVRGFLDALGVEPGRVPVDPQAQTGLLRSLVAHKRMLIVLDNAANSEQVVPLLPGGDSCTVVVTSRRTLTDLITRHNAHHLTLDTLTDDDARALLTRRLGTARVAAEPEAVGELIGSCCGFPLALGIIAGRAHAHPRAPLAEFAAELRDVGVSALEDDDPAAGLPTALSWSYRALPAQQQVAFGLLGIAPGPDIGLPAASSLTGLPPAQTGKVLRGLEEASLLARDPCGRYSMHDLIRHYASDTAHKWLPDHVRGAALRRVVDFYLHTARTADRHLNPNRPAPRFDLPGPDCHPHPLPDDTAALAWFDAEHSCLLATQHTATIHEWHQAVWQLAWTLGVFHTRRGHRRDRLAVWQAGLAAAERLHDPNTHILASRFLGNAYAELGRREEAISHLRRALALARQHHNHTDQADIHRMLAQAWGQWGDDRQALEHTAHALSIYRTLGNPVWEAWTLNEMGWYAARLGDHDQARGHCEAALTLFRRHPDPTGEAATWDSLGYIAYHAAHHETAIDHYQRAVSLYRDLGHTYEVAKTLDGLGHPHAALGQHDQAHAVWREALELYRSQGRDENAARLQRQLDDLEVHDDGDQPHPSAESAK